MLACVRSLLIVPAMFVGAAGLVGCSSNGDSTMSSSSMKVADSAKDTAVVVSSNGGSTVVYTLGGRGGGSPMTVYGAKGTKMCSECEMDAKSYFETGKLEPMCKVCGAKRTISPATGAGAPNAYKS
jgi:hypothetical protein